MTTDFVRLSSRSQSVIRARRLLCVVAAVLLHAVAPLAAHSQDELIKCDSFWDGGLPLAGRSYDAPIYCHEYLPGPGSSAVLTGVPFSDRLSYRIFLAESIDPAAPEPLLRLDWLADGIDEVVGSYQRIGGAVEFYIYVSDVPYGGSLPDPGGILASRSSDYSDGEPCPIFFYPASLSLGVDRFKQTLAHEAFHCIQSSRYWDQTKAGGGVRYKDWWVEGTAQYFGNTVYPDVNQEWDHSRRYDPDNALFDYAYEAGFFFQDLANQVGDEGILSLLASLPTTAGADLQRNALAAFPNIQEHWHGFGQRYLDQRVRDTGPLFVPVEPQKGDLVRVDGSSSVGFAAPAFTLVRRTLEFAPGQSVRITVEETGGEGRVSARDVAPGAAWGDLPNEIITECEASRTFELLATSAAPATADYDVSINFESVQRPECSHTCTPSGAHDACVVGTWIADNEFTAEQMRRLLGRAVDVASIEGEERVTYQADGLAAGSVATTTRETARSDAGDIPVQVDINSAGTSVWSTEGATLSTCAVSESASARTQIDFPGNPERGRPPMRSTPGVAFAYLCGGDVLELTLPGGVMKKRYNRVPE